MPEINYQNPYTTLLTSEKHTWQGQAVSKPQVLFEINRLEHSILHCHVARGELVKCGYGYATKELALTLAARMASFASVLSPQSVLCHFTAAWVWNCLNPLPKQLHLQHRNTSLRTREAHNTIPIIYHHMRLTPQELYTINDYAVTTPERTLYDLLYNYHSQGSAVIPIKTHHTLQDSKAIQEVSSAVYRTALQKLATISQLASQELQLKISQKKHPRKKYALANLQLLEAAKQY